MLQETVRSCRFQTGATEALDAHRGPLRTRLSNHAAAISSVNEALRTEKMVVLIEEVEVSDAAAAQTLRFPGSPTIASTV